MKSSANIRNVFTLLIINGGMSVLAMLASVLLANHMGPKEFGRYSLAIAVATYFMVLTRYGRDRSMVRAIIQHPSRRPEIIGSSIIVSGTIYAIVIVFAAAWGLFIDIDKLYILAYIGAMCLSSLDLQPVYDSDGKTKFHALCKMLERLVPTIFIIVSIFYFSEVLNLITLAAATAVGTMLSLALQYKNYNVLGVTSSVVKGIKSDSVLLAKQGWPLMLGAVVTSSCAPTIRILLESNASVQALGIYSAGWQIPLAAKFCVDQIARVGAPAINRSIINTNIIRRRIAVAKYAVLMAGVALPAMLICFVFPKKIAELFYSKDYQDVALLLPGFGVQVFLYSVSMVGSQVCVALGKDVQFAGATIVAALIGVATGILFIAKLGAVGAVYALVVYQFVLLISTMFHVLKVMKND